MSQESRLLLVSGSPRRRELLDLIRVPYRVLAAGIDESRLAGEAPDAYVVRLARAKARAGRQADHDPLPALGADTIVLIDGKVLGKPATREEARAMLAALAGRAHEVLTAVAVVDRSDRLRERLSRSRVEFGPVPDAWIDAYCRTAEPMDKAGAYAIQGLTAQWVRRVDGSYSGVMGLPLYETAELLRASGFTLAPEIAP